MLSSNGYIHELRYPLCVSRRPASVSYFLFFFFNDTATTEIYTLSLHDALPISEPRAGRRGATGRGRMRRRSRACEDRKSTRLNSSHSQISYAVFCLKKKKHYLVDRAFDDEHLEPTQRQRP